MIDVETRREIVAQYRALEDRSPQAPSLVIEGRALSHETALAQFLRAAGDASVQEIREQLRNLAAEQDRRDANRLPERPELDPNAPDEVGDAYRADLAESARVRAERERTPATMAGLDELREYMVEMFERIEKQLEQRG